MTAVKERLHHLVDALPEGAATVAAERALSHLRKYWQDPLARKLLSAPIDEEDETAQERALVDEAREDFAAGRTVTHEQVRTKLGL